GSQEAPARKGARGDEDALDEPSSPQEDIFRVGEVLYRCVTGHKPYDPARPGRAPQPVRQAAPEVPAMLAELIDRLLQPVAAHRPKTAAAVAKSRRVFLRTDEEEKQSRVEEKLVVPVSSPTPSSDGAGADAGIGPIHVDVASLTEDENEPEIASLFRAVI